MLLRGAQRLRTVYRTNKHPVYRIHQYSINDRIRLPTGLFLTSSIHYRHNAILFNHKSRCLPTEFVQHKRFLSTTTSTGGKRKTLEEIYQKKTPIEHILLRPDSYIGSLELTKSLQWVYDKHQRSLKLKEIEYVPGLYKIFDEILVNASDNIQRDPNTDTIKVDIDENTGTISIYNNGKSIPIEIHKEEKVYFPELLLGQLLTGSNFDDSVSKVTGGRNGYGAKLTNIFSKEFTVEIVESRRRLQYVQTWSNHMSTKTEPIITQLPADQEVSDYTKITFRPDLQLFHMKSLKDTDILRILERRVYDMAACHQNVSVYLNGTKLVVNPARYFDVNGQGIVFEKVNSRWVVGVGTTLQGNFSQISFVNGIHTLRGGTHVQYITDQIVKYVVEKMRKRSKEIPVFPNQVRNHLHVAVICLIENPSFDSQTKETLTTQPTHFGSACNLSERFLKAVLQNTNIVELVSRYAEMQRKQSLVKSLSAKRKLKVSGIDKLDDANEAGGPESASCTLIITEGDSAKALAVSGLSVVGRDYYGVYPVQGKLLNVREAKTPELVKNDEILNLIKIIGLRHDCTYENWEKDSKSLRYGRIMLMTDSDHDGSHIKGLFINFLHHFWPALLKREGFLVEFITPIVKAFPSNSKKAQPISFYSLQEYNAWKESLGPNIRSWRIKYYKGLGTSTAAEAREYFSDLSKHVVRFRWTDTNESELIDMAFNKAKAAERKEWLKTYQRNEQLDLTSGVINYTDFINKELLAFSHYDTVRSIPSLVDGLKPSQRKVLYACFKKKLNFEMKVSQLAGFVAEQAAYHHGEVSLFGTIINMAQNFVGSNNLPLLYASGQFGTRLQGGKDAASARYIYTRLSDYTNDIFMPDDEDILNYLDDDGFPIEPEYYVPIIPMTLVNGAEGVGTGYRTAVPCYNPLDVIDNLIRKIDGEPLKPMIPWFRGFTGEVKLIHDENNIPHSFVTRGIIEETDNGFVVTELPIGKWTYDYKVYLNSLIKPQNYIKDFTEHHTDEQVKFVITVSNEQMQQIKKDLEGVNGDLIKLFKLENSFTMKHMNLFDKDGVLKHYDDVLEILEDFFAIRSEYYAKRKEKLVAKMERNLFRISQQCKFLELVTTNKVNIINVSKDDVQKQLEAHNFTPLPPRSDPDGTPSFDYLLSFSLSQLSKENIARLRAEQMREASALQELKELSPLQLWRKDLVALREKLSKLCSYFFVAFGAVRLQSNFIAITII